MIDLKTVADTLYAPRVPDVPVVPPVEAKPTAEPTTTTPARQQAADGTRHTTMTEQKPDVGYPLALPEDALLEASAIERTEAFAKAAGLSPAAAQQALNHANAEVLAYRDHEAAEWNTLTRKTWIDDATNDPEIGGEKFDGSVKDARQFLREFGDKEIRKFLDDSGFGNNRFVIRMFARAMKRMAPDTPVTRAAGGGGEKPDAATVLYGR